MIVSTFAAKNNKKMRKLTNLYEITIENIDLLDSGICDLLDTLFYRKSILTREEYYRLQKHFYKSKPSVKRRFKKFTVHHTWNGVGFWWPQGEKEQRKKFLIALREYSKPWYKKIWWI